MKKLIIIALILSIPMIVFANIYKWTDEQGIIHFSDTPVELPDNAEQIQGNKKPQQPEPYVSKIPIRPPKQYFEERIVRPNQTIPKIQGAINQPYTEGMKQGQENLEKIIIKTFAPLFTILLTYGIILIWTLTDILRSKFQGNEKFLWIWIIFIPILGIIAYTIIGRKQKIKNEDLDF